MWDKMEQSQVIFPQDTGEWPLQSTSPAAQTKIFSPFSTELYAFSHYLYTVLSLNCTQLVSTSSRLLLIVGLLPFHKLSFNIYCSKKSERLSKLSMLLWVLLEEVEAVQYIEWHAVCYLSCSSETLYIVAYKACTQPVSYLSTGNCKRSYSTHLEVIEEEAKNLSII